jgi:hypothetical protein
MQRAIVQQAFFPKAEPIVAGDVVRPPGPARQSPANSFNEGGNFIAHRIQRRSEEPVDAGSDEIGAVESRVPLNAPAPVPAFRVSRQAPNMPAADSVAASLLSGATQQGPAFPGSLNASHATPFAPANFTPVSVLRRKPLLPGSRAVPDVGLQTMLFRSSLFRVSSSRADHDSAPALLHAVRPEMVSSTPLVGPPSALPAESSAAAFHRSPRASLVPAIHTSISSVYREHATAAAASYPGATFAPAPPPVPYARAPESEIRKLAEQVYQLITRRLASERERRGLS